MKTATNKTARTNMMETLEPRRMMSVSVDAAGVLQVVGTTGADTITVTETDTKVTVSGASSNGFSTQLSKVLSIVVRSGDGNDSVSINAGIHADVYAGAGDDTVVFQHVVR